MLTSDFPPEITIYCTFFKFIFNLGLSWALRIWAGPSGIPLVALDKKDHNPDMGKSACPPKNTYGPH